MTARIISRYGDEKGTWLKGNLHTHTTNSDGTCAPQAVVDTYAKNGFDFLTLSDHDGLTPIRGLKSRGMILIPGYEVTANGPHILHINPGKVIAPSPDRQKVLDAIARDRGAIAIMCHPEWTASYEHCTLAELLKLDKYSGIEINNGVCVFEQGSALALREWDQLAARGKIVLGYGNDDAHTMEKTGLAANIVFARNRSAGAVLDAFRRGCFYVSSGVIIQSIKVRDGGLMIKTKNAEKIVVIGRNGRRVFAQDGRDMFFKPELSLNYFRVDCYGYGDSRAWTQFFRVESASEQEAHSKRNSTYLTGARIASAPELTGRLSDPAWRNAHPANGFLNLNTGDPAGVQTSVRMLTDGNTLYFGFECDEPSPRKLRKEMRGHNTGQVYSDDSVEVFLDPCMEGKNYLHVVVNALGYVDVEWNRKLASLPGIRARTSIGRNRWTAEVAVPLHLLEEPPRGAKPGTLRRRPVLRGNFCRNRWGGGEESSNLVWTGQAFHVPGRFGKIRF